METSSNKSKPVTTSVPSISIKFHANAEEIEEFYNSDNEAGVEKSSEKLHNITSQITPTSNIGDQDASPLKYFPKLGKRSTSIDVSPGNIDNSPPSDPWRFFSDIRGKITKSVEDKITEIKARNQEEGSPLHKSQKNETKIVKDSKESSSVSDSEDLSESSISKTCGVVSTTEGVEMSSDEDTPSLDKDKEKKHLAPSSLRRKFRLFRSKQTTKEGTVKINSLSKLYNINAEKVEQAFPEHSEEVESGVDALEDYKDVNEDSTNESSATNKIDNEKILTSVEEKYHNIEIDLNDVVNVKEVTGTDIRQSYFSDEEKTLTVFAPTGFVDLRPISIQELPTDSNYWPWIALVISFALYVILHRYNSYSAGFLAGVLLTLFIVKMCMKFYVQALGTNNAATMVPSSIALASRYLQCQRIVEIQAIKEYQPLTKFEGWANEYPDVYSPNTYHISRTQSVFLRLQGNLLRISHAKSKIPKRAMWNEPKIKANFTHHRIYNLLDAKIKLLPVGLTRKRLWSKKYPICIVLNKDQMNFDTEILKHLEEEKDEKVTTKVVSAPQKPKRKFNFKKKDYAVLTQRFSKLNEGDDFDLDSDSRASTPSPENSDIPLDELSTPVHQQASVHTKENNEDAASLFDELCFDSQDVSITNNEKLLTTKDRTKENSNELRIYIFGRTDREKEDWFRRFAAATHKSNANLGNKDTDADSEEQPFESLQVNEEYLKYMLLFRKPSKKISTQEKPRKDSHKLKKDSDKPRKDSDKPRKDSDKSKIDMLIKKDLDKQEKDSDKYDTDNSDEADTPKKPRYDEVMWLNALIGRVLFDCVRDPNFTARVKDRIQRKLSAIKLPYFIEELLVTEMSLGKTPPFINRTTKPVLDERGLWVDLDITYEGLIVLTLQTKLNLMKLKNPQHHEKPLEEVRSAIYYSDVDDTAESSSDSEGPQELHLIQDGTALTNTGSSSNSGKKIIKMVDRIAESKFFQAATENRYIKKAMEEVSNTDLRLTVELRALAGTMVLNIPQPPSDRLWIGFRPVPEILLSARPIVGERNINYTMVTSWVEKKLIQEFQKILVIPNMDDFVIPVMNRKLPK